MITMLFMLMLQIKWNSEMMILMITCIDTYLVRVAHTKSAGSVAGKERACRILVPLWRNIQLAKPLFADSIYVWKTVNTVSGIFPINAACNTKHITFSGFSLTIFYSKWYTLRCCWHSVHSGSNSWVSGAASCTTKVDWTAKHRVQLIRLFRCRNCSASSKPCWHIFDSTSGFGGKRMRMKRFIFWRDNSMLVFAQFT